MRHAVIEVLGGPLAGMAFPLVYQELTIGRSKSCTICPEGYTELSRRHAEILWDGAVFVLQDAGSKNGIVFGKEVVSVARLSDGDEAILGDFSFRLHIPEGGPEFAGAAPPAATPAPPEPPSRPTIPSGSWGWAVAAVVAAIVLVVAMANKGGRNGAPHGPVAGVHDETYEVAEPDGVKGHSVDIIAGAQKQPLNGSTATVSMKNNIPQLVASIDSAGKPVLLAIVPPGSTSAELSAQSTAEALVYCTPFLCPTNARDGQRLLGLVQDSSEVKDLANLIASREKESIGSLVKSDADVRQALSSARKAVARHAASSASAQLRGPRLVLADWAGVLPSGDNYGVELSLQNGNQLVVSNGKHHWLVVSGLRGASAVPLVPSNPTVLDVSSLGNQWHSSETFDLSDSSSSPRIYGWGPGATQYTNASSQSDDGRYVTQAMCCTVVFDGLFGICLTEIGLSADWNSAPDAVKIGWNLMGQVLQGQLATDVANDISQGNGFGALREIMGAVFGAVASGNNDTLTALAGAIIGGDPNLGYHLAGILVDLAGGDWLQQLQTLGDVAALVLDNLGPSFVIGVTLQAPPPVVAAPTPSPPAQQAPTTPQPSPSPDIEQRLQREGAQTGEVQVSLAWDNYNDLDLHVETPSGEEIWYAHRTSSDGGQLDVDMNVQPTTNQPVENVVWPAGRAPRGHYKVSVVHYRNHGLAGCEDPTAFTVSVKVGGQEIARQTGSISARQRLLVYEFDVGGGQ